MKKWVIIFLFLCSAGRAMAQQQESDSLKALLSNTDNDSLRVIYYCLLSDLYADFLPDSAIFFAQAGLDISIETGSEKGQSRCLTRIGNVFLTIGEFPKALEKHLASLKLSESIEDPVGIAASYNNMAEVYKEQGDFRNALEYYGKSEIIFRKIISQLESETIVPVPEDIGEKIKDYKYYVGIILLNTGDLYERMNLLDSSLYFQQRAYTSAFANNDVNILGAILSNLGVVYTRLEQAALSLENFRKSIPYLVAEEDKRFLAISYHGMSEIFEKAGKTDSALVYARKSLASATDGSFQKEILNAAVVLSRLFEKKHRPDSAFYYQKMVARVKDTIYTQENVRKVESLNFGEKIRQQELALAKAKAAKARSDKIQYFVISIAIVSVFIVLILLRKRKSKTKLIEYLGVIGLLLMFEFIALFIHPYIGSWTHHKPIYMLLILAGIGAVLTPLHHVLTRWIKQKMAHKHSEALPVDKAVTPQKDPLMQVVSATPAQKIKGLKKKKKRRK